MKKFYTLILFLPFTLGLNAAVHTVTVANFSFSPAATNAVCGDTIKWIWSSGTHTTTSTSVPAGANTWDHPITAGATTYSLVVTIAGNYSYQCTMHPTTMLATLVVTCANGVVPVNNNYFSSSYPDPFSDQLTIEVPDADMIALYNIVGEKIRTISLQHGQTKTEINAADLREGIYFYCIIKEGIVIETRKVVKN